MQEMEAVRQYYLDREYEADVDLECLHRDKVSSTLRWRCPLEERVVTVKAILVEGAIKITRLD